MAAPGAGVESSQHVVEHVGEVPRRRARPPGIADCSRVVHCKRLDHTRYFGIRLSRAHCLDNTSARTMSVTTNNALDMASPALPWTPNDAIRMLIVLSVCIRKTNRDGKVIDNNRSRARILVVP